MGRAGHASDASSRQGSTRRPDLTLDEIVDATLRLIRRDGLDKLSMRSVAEELGAATMATYNYVASKDELVALAHDAVSREWEPLVLGEDGWEAALRRYLRSQWGTYRRYPGLAAWKMSRPHFGTTPETHAVWLQFFSAAGFDERQALLVWSFAETYVMGRLTVEARLRGARDRTPRGRLAAREYVEHGIEAVIAGIRGTL